MTESLASYDPAEDLGSDEAIAIFMAEAFQTGNAAYISHALGVVARVKGMAQIAGQTGLSRAAQNRLPSTPNKRRLSMVVRRRKPAKPQPGA